MTDTTNTHGDAACKVVCADCGVTIIHERRSKPLPAVPAQSAPTPEPRCSICGGSTFSSQFGRCVCLNNRLPIPPTSAPGGEGGEAYDLSLWKAIAKDQTRYVSELEAEIADLKRQLGEAEHKGYEKAVADARARPGLP